MSNITKAAKYTFRGRSGYIIDSINATATHKLVAIGHTASVTPWIDPGIHKHGNSEECFFLLEGELQFLIAESLVTLRPREVLMIRPQVPHAIVGGKGLVEHIGIRTPALKDKQMVGEIPQKLPEEIKGEPELQLDWGFRASLEAARNQNCWLIGTGSARFESPHLVLAYLNYSTTEAANEGIGARHRLHFHQRSWEYYVTLKGTRTLQVENELVSIEAGEMLEVPPQVSHTLYDHQAPYEGFTFRVPVELNDKVEC